MSSQFSNPPDIARETLKTLALRKIQPTPENYSKIYAEISGSSPEENPGAQQVLQKIADTLATQPGKSAIIGRHLIKSLNANDWQTYLDELSKILPVAKDGSELIPSWAELIRDLLRQIETPHKGLTITRKKEGLETVLTKFASNPENLFEKLTGLMRSWTVNSSSTENTSLVANEITPEINALPALAATAATSTTTPAPPPSTLTVATPTVSPADASTSEMQTQLRELLAQTLEITLISLPEFQDEVTLYAEQIRTATDYDRVTKLAKELRNFWLKVELRGGDKVKVQEGLIRLLRLLVENVGELIEDEEWLHGQISTLQEIVAHPINKLIIADAERSLREAIIKQSLLKQSLTDAKTTLKMLMTSFVDRLGEMTESTGEYHQKIEAYSQKIGTTNNITELSHLLDDIMKDTRVLQASAIRSHEELLNTRKQVQEAEDKIKQLEQELDQVSELVREDQLTGALNRRGLEETFEREAKRANRSTTPLCVALLDIDNFKKLNDRLGHQAGDHALIHLINVVKEALRPSDSVARYGGEEFIILLPDVSVEDAYLTLSRLQRELTKKFFLHENERVLITFSAGVALLRPEEDQESIIGRADKAMYQAKQSGKNQVIIAD